MAQHHRDHDRVSDFPFPDTVDATLGISPTLRPPPVPAVQYPTIGAVIDDTYRIVRHLGEGGMGVVVLARDERLDREVAIKLVRPELVALPQARERLLREARAMARVRHSNVVEIHAFGQFEDTSYFVMEYVPGMDLERLLQRRAAPVTLSEAHGLLDQVCCGVEAIHAAGTVHRDLKSANVLIGEGLRVAITDLGLARILDEASSDGIVSGTPAYMAPELLGASSLSFEELARADVYSLGVIAYEVLVGRLPFEADDLPSTLLKHASEPPPSLCDARNELSSAHEEVVHAALEKNPARRTPSAAELRRALAQAWENVRSAQAPLRILVVDDDQGFRRAIVRTLAAAFPTAIIDVAADGEAGFACARANLPSLVVSDLDMPGWGGTELTAALRAYEVTRQVPIVVATGIGGPAEWRKLMELGADGFMIKPFELAHLVSMAENLLAREASWRPKAH